MGARQQGNQERKGVWSQGGGGISRQELWPRLSVGRWPFSNYRGGQPQRVCPHTQGIRWGFLRSLRAWCVWHFFQLFPWTANSHAQFLVLNKNSRNPACSSRLDIWTYWTTSVVFPSLRGQGTHVSPAEYLCMLNPWVFICIPWVTGHQESNIGCGWVTCPLAYPPTFSLSSESGWLRAGAEGVVSFCISRGSAVGLGGLWILTISVCWHSSCFLAFGRCRPPRDADWDLQHPAPVLLRQT